MKTNRKQGFNPEENRRNNNRENQSNGRWPQDRHLENYQPNDSYYGYENYNQPRHREDEHYDTYRNHYTPDSSREYSRGYSSSNDRNYEDRGYTNHPRYTDNDSRWSDSDNRNQDYRNSRNREIDNDYRQRNDYRGYDNMHESYGRGYFNETESDRRKMDESVYRGENEDYISRGYTTRSGKSGYGGRSNNRNQTW